VQISFQINFDGWGWVGWRWGWLDEMKIRLTQPSFAKLGLGLSLAKKPPLIVDTLFSDSAHKPLGTKYHAILGEVMTK
jgi:hypothetical protein